ncbi:unnamed protein product [Phytophthora lilii]|uniref:Unnamed protein product n=1 Tax=Phytophthora lilii TaxID=2077276 RepID=A0A9W7CG63_9STRA|nr:unnamed protein product [Phytophthora lilii]
MKALKSPELVARVMGHALIAKDHMIGDESDGRQPAGRMEVEMHERSEHGGFESALGNVQELPYSKSENCLIAETKPSPESSPERPNRLNLSFILGAQ